MLIEIDNKIISSEVFDRKFVCDLNACKGACCIEGDAGAPINKAEELAIIAHLPKIKPFMQSEGVTVINTQGVSCKDPEGDLVTTLINGKECAFVHYDEHNIAKCAIETACIAEKIPNLKPISCHLYPIRVKQINDYIAINFDEWKVCGPACVCGEKLAVPVFRFLKTPLVRAFGESFYKELELVAKEIELLE